MTKIKWKERASHHAYSYRYVPNLSASEYEANLQVISTTGSVQVKKKGMLKGNVVSLHGCYRNSGLYTTILTVLIDSVFEATCILCEKGSSPSGTHSYIYEKDFIPLDNSHLT